MQQNAEWGLKWPKYEAVLLVLVGWFIPRAHSVVKHSCIVMPIHGGIVAGSGVLLHPSQCHSSRAQPRGRHLTPVWEHAVMWKPGFCLLALG